MRLLGKDIGYVSEPETYSKIYNLLESETNDHGQYRLANDMTAGSFEYDAQFNRNKVFLNKLYQGFSSAKVIFVE